MKITIIGAGIAGLTTAIALKKYGFEVDIFESSPEFKKAGSGINLAANAMQIFRRLGLYDKIAKTGSHTNALYITDHKMKEISKIDLADIEKEFDTKSFAIHRATLHSILLEELADTSIHLNKKLDYVSQSKEEVFLRFKDGAEYNTDLLIGADGIHSAVRNFVLKNTKLRSASQVCWRGVVKASLPDKYKTELNELWGRGKRFGFVSISEDEVYWYALANYRKDYLTEYQNTLLPVFFQDFDPLVSQLIASTNLSNILINDMIDLSPISKWYNGNICLVGDSAHATTPNMGQGACQAIESAYVFAKCLSEESDFTTAFQKFQKLRQKGSQRIIKMSWQIGRISQLENRWVINLRNAIIRSLPKGRMQKQSHQIYHLRY